MNLRIAVLALMLVSSVAAQAQGLFDLKPHRRLDDPRVRANPDHWMVIVGDSGVTGAASGKDIEAVGWNLLGHVTDFLLNITDPGRTPPLSDFPAPERFGINKVEPMTRIVYSQREMEDARRKNQLKELFVGAKASLALDVQEHGSGYMIGRALGMKGGDIVLAGQDGKRVSAIPEQFERIYEIKTESLPPLVLISFTANDFCNESVFTDSLETLRERFAASLAEAWDRTAPFLKPHPKGTQILVLPALEVANVITNEKLAQQEIGFQGLGRISCRRLRERDALDGILSEKTANALGNMCRSVLLTRPSETARVQRLRDIQNSFNDVWKRQISALRAKHPQIIWTYAESVRDLEFTPGDLANDCFHPGVGGHAKIADHLLRTVFDR